MYKKSYSVKEVAFFIAFFNYISECVYIGRNAIYILIILKIQYSIFQGSRNEHRP